MKKYSGFTLIELLVVVAIIAIMIAVSTPFLTKIINNEKINSIYEELIMDVETAKITAITTNKNVSLNFNVNNGIQYWELRTNGKVLKKKEIENIPAYLEFNYGVINFSPLGLVKNSQGFNINNTFIRVCNLNKEGNLILLNSFAKIETRESSCI